tara:strand:- start:269 stop:1426 length:1158 start_codon:yes stop_codon:yes gene_type:complete
METMDNSWVDDAFNNPIPATPSSGEPKPTDEEREWDKAAAIQAKNAPKGSGRPVGKPKKELKKEPKEEPKDEETGEDVEGLTGQATSFNIAARQAESATEKREQMRQAALAAEEAASVAGMSPLPGRETERATAQERQRMMAEALGIPVSAPNVGGLESQIRELEGQASALRKVDGKSTEEWNRLDALVAEVDQLRTRARETKPAESDYARLQREQDVHLKRSAAAPPTTYSAAAPAEAIASESTLEVATTKVLARLDAIRQLKEEVEAAQIEAKSFPETEKRTTRTYSDLPLVAPSLAGPTVARLMSQLPKYQEPTAVDEEISRRDKQLKALEELETNLDKIVRTSLGRPVHGAGGAEAVSASERDLAKMRETVKNMTGTEISE